MEKRKNKGHANELPKNTKELKFHEVPPYTRINMAISSEGVQVELEENADFEDAHDHYEKLLIDVAKQFAGRQMNTKKRKAGDDVEIT